MWKEMLQPSQVAFKERPQAVGSTISRHDADGMPDLRDHKLCLVGLPDTLGSHLAADAIRQQFFELITGGWDFTWADAGNIIPGRDAVDLMAAVEEIGVEIMQRGSIPVFIGGSSDQALGLYRAYSRLEQLVNMTVLHREIPIGTDQGAPHAENWISHVLTAKPYQLFHLAFIGYQSYFVDQNTLDIVEKMHFEAERLGTVADQITRIEPLLRDMDMIVADNQVMTCSQAPGQSRPNPNGLSAKDFCAAMRYAGMSDKASSFFITGYVPEEDIHALNAMTLAQGLWYIAEGVQWRKGDFPMRPIEDYLKFTVWLEGEQDYEMTFYKSPISGRWWMEVPVAPGKDARLSMVPCSQEDYELAVKGEVPPRWWKASRRAI